MARMYGVYARPCCPHCRNAYGPDCADKARGKRKQRQLEERQWRREVEQDVDDVLDE